MRRAVAENFCGLLDSLGCLDASLRLRKARYILAYHRVLTAQEAASEWCHPSLWVSPGTFARHLQVLTTLGRVLPVSQLLQTPATHENLFALTFDDAWADNFHSALPIMQRYGMTACFFVATDAVDSGRLFWTEELALDIGRSFEKDGGAAFMRRYGDGRAAAARASTEALLAVLMCLIERLKELAAPEREAAIAELYRELGAQRGAHTGRIMSWSQLRTLAAAGHIIGSHTRTHRILTGTAADIVDAEMTESRHTIEREIGAAPDLFCFPNARFDRVSASRVLANGYRYGFAMHNRPVARHLRPELVTRFSMCEKNSRPAILKARWLKSWLASPL